MRKQALLWGSFLSLALAGSLGYADERPSEAKAMSWATPDGVRLVGTYKAPKAPGHRVWVLLHGLGSNRHEWNGFARKLAQQGDGFLIYDARGHGDSIRYMDGKTIGYVEFKQIGRGSQWDAMISDLGTAVQVLNSQCRVDPSRVRVGGASLGANVALAYASERPDVSALILLSPGLQYAGIESESAFRKYGPRPVFIAASAGDVYAFNSVQQLTALRSDAACQTVLKNGTGHGVNMFDDAFTQKLLAWIKQVK